MMKFEESLAKTDLNVFKQRPIENLAREITRYKDWTTSSALARINYATLSKSTAAFYFDNGVRYLNGLTCTLSKPFKALLDKYSKETTPLRPSVENRRRFVTRTTTHKIPPVTDCVTDCIKPKEEATICVNPKVVEVFLYGALIDNVVVTFKTQKELQAFIQGYRFNKPDAKIKEITIDEAVFKEDNNG